VPLVIGSITFLIYYAFRRWKKTWPAFSIALVLGSAIFGPLIHFNVGPFTGQATFTTFGFAELIPTMPTLLRDGIFDDISALLGIALAIAFLASLENTLMAKSIASQTGDRLDSNQDMLSVGYANLGSALAGGMPASGSLTRSSRNFHSGAATKAAPVYTGIFTLILVVLIAWSGETGLNLIDYIPRAALAVLIIAISFSLINIRQIRICLRSTGDDALVIVLTFLATLLAPLHVAIFIGVAISITLPSNGTPSHSFTILMPGLIFMSWRSTQSTFGSVPGSPSLRPSESSSMSMPYASRSSSRSPSSLYVVATSGRMSSIAANDRRSLAFDER
jgi:SulP family sulfate permease